MKKRKSSKDLRRKAELAAVNWCYEENGCVSHVRAVRTQWQRQDLFGADIIARDANGRDTFIQVTTGGHSAISSRKNKIKKHPWAPDARVAIFQLFVLPDPNNLRRNKYYFKQYWFFPESGEWSTDELVIEIKNEWLKTINREEVENELP
jgi:hypothetical protein